MSEDAEKELNLLRKQDSLTKYIVGRYLSQAKQG